MFFLAHINRFIGAVAAYREQQKDFPIGSLFIGKAWMTSDLKIILFQRFTKGSL